MKRTSANMLAVIESKKRSPSLDIRRSTITFIGAGLHLEPAEQGATRVQRRFSAKRPIIPPPRRGVGYSGVVARRNDASRFATRVRSVVHSFARGHRVGASIQSNCVEEKAQ